MTKIIVHPELAARWYADAYRIVTEPAKHSESLRRWAWAVLKGGKT